MSLLLAVITLDVVFMRTLPEADTKHNPACEGENAGFVSDMVLAAVYPTTTVKWNTVQ